MTKPTPAAIHARRIGPTLTPDRLRVLMRPFYPTSDDIARKIAARVLALPDEEVSRLLGRVLGEFEDRHEHVEQFFRNRTAALRELRPLRTAVVPCSRPKRIAA